MSGRSDRGGFITLEGGEGAGKSTQASRLVSRLAARGFRTLGTREPGGSPKAEAIRRAVLSGAAKPFGPLAEALMFSAARLDHIEKLIGPALEMGSFVVCDRFLDSTRVYQGLLGELDAGLVATLERVVVGETMPDLTLILDVDPAVGTGRARARRGRMAAADRFELEDPEYHVKLRAGFLDILKREPERCRLVDGSQTQKAVAEAIWLEVLGRFPAVRDADNGLVEGEDS